MSGTRTIQEIQRSILLKKVFKKTVLTIIIFTVAIIYFSPVLYMHLSAFKTEYDAVSPSLFFSPTLETFQKVLGDENMYGYLKNSLFQVCAGTIICLLLGIPAAFALAFGKFKSRHEQKGLSLVPDHDFAASGGRDHSLVYLVSDIQSH